MARLWLQDFHIISYITDMDTFDVVYQYCFQWLKATGEVSAFFDYARTAAAAYTNSSC